MTSRNSTEFIRHFFLVFGSQLVVFASGLVKTLFVPVLLGISDYGYWQIYVFYSVYVGVFTFGYNDGIYLKYGGLRLEELPFAKLRASNVFHIFLLSLGMAVVAVAATFATDPVRKIIFFAVAANILVLGITSNISLSLQAVNRMKSYAFLNAADKIFFTIALIALFSPGLRTFWFLIAVDLVGKTAVLVALLVCYPQLYAGPFSGMSLAFTEFRENLRSGSQLMIANLSGMLVLGSGRMIIEYFGTLDSYSNYALATSLANIALISITAMSIVIYPHLKQSDEKSYLLNFERANSAYFAFSLLMMTSYFAALAFIMLVAKGYAPVVKFLNVVFAITVLQGKMQLVNNTFYKALRLEGAMLRANLTSLLIASGLSALGYILTQLVISIAYATLFTMLLRVYASEIFLRQHMAGPRSNSPLLETAVLAAFLVLTTFAAPIAGCLAWMVVVCLVTLVNHRQILVTVRKLRSRGR